jgi:general secretion pathway protein L
MNELTLFWGYKEEATFRWKFTQNDKQAHGQPAIHHLESEEILKQDLSCVADMAKGCKVSLIVSNSDIVCANLKVPNKANKLLRKAVPYMMEDDIATPVDQLFFALADKTKDSMLAVRAIDRYYLESILNTFKAAEIKLHKLLVDSDLVDKPNEGYRVFIEQQNCLIIDQDNNRWHCYKDDFSWLIQKQISQVASEDDMPVALPLEIISQQPTDEFEHQLPVGRFAVESKQVEDYYQQLLSESGEALNLLQAEYEPKKESSKNKFFSVKVATMVGVVLGFFLLYQAINVYVLSDTKEKLNEQKLALLKQAFPRKKKPTEKDLRIYMKSLGNNSGQGGFLSLLNSTSESLTDLDKIYPTNISYDHARNELRMDVIAADLVVLDQYADTLRKKGHKVDKSSETQRGEGYSSRLTISR